MKLSQRIKEPTPPFFKKIRNIGLLLATIGGTILTAPVVLPSILVTIATYMTVAGTVATTVSQVVVSDTKKEDAK